MSAPVRLVDFDGTLARIHLPWEAAREEAARRGLPAGVRRALDADHDGAYWSWLDEFEAGAIIQPLHPALHEELHDAAFHWAIVTDNGAPIVARAVAAGLVPPPDAVISRRWGRPMKPHPAPLLEALEVLGTTSAGATMTGDTSFDEDAATAVGIPFVSVDRYQAVGIR